MKPVGFYKKGGKTRPISSRKLSTRGDSNTENQARKGMVFTGGKWRKEVDAHIYNVEAIIQGLDEGGMNQLANTFPLGAGIKKRMDEIGAMADKTNDTLLRVRVNQTKETIDKLWKSTSERTKYQEQLEQDARDVLHMLRQLRHMLT